MLLLLLGWTFLFAVSWLTGIAILGKIAANNFNRPADRWLPAVWLGLCFLSSLLLAASLLTPLTPLVALSLALLVVVFSLGLKRTRRELKTVAKTLSVKLLVSLFVLSAVCAVYVNQAVEFYDTGLYHFGAIRWLSDYGAVPGLALLHHRFGYASSWFALSAPFNAGWLEGRMTTVANGFVLFLVVLHVVVCLHRCLTRRGKLADWFILFSSPILLILAVYIGNWQASASPNLPVAALAIVTVWTLLIVSNPDAADTENNSPGYGAMIPSDESPVSL